MSTPSGYPGNDPYGTQGQYPTGGSTPGYSTPGQHPSYQQAPYPGPDQYAQQPYQGSGGFPAPNQYGQPAYGQPAYGQPGYGGSGIKARPGMVTAAAVLAFVWGGLGILFGTLGLFAGSLLSTASNVVCDNATLDNNSAVACSAASSVSTYVIVITLGLIVIAALMIWGGVVALNGKNGQILVIACGIYAALALVSVFSLGFEFTSLLGFIIPVLILVFMFNADSRAWFRAKGGKTF